MAAGVCCRQPRAPSQPAPRRPSPLKDTLFLFGNNGASTARGQPRPPPPAKRPLPAGSAPPVASEERPFSLSLSIACGTRGTQKVYPWAQDRLTHVQLMLT